MSLNLKYSELCDIIWNRVDDHEPHIDSLVSSMKSKYSLSDCDENNVRKQLIKLFIFQFKQKWSAASRKKDIFKKRHKDFLEKTISIKLHNESSSNQLISPGNTLSTSKCLTATGRPRLSFEEGSSKTQYRHAVEIANKYTQDELSLALKIKIRLSSTKNVSENEVCDQESDVPATELINKSLCMFSDLHLSYRKYEKLRSYNQLIFKNKLYPRYRMITEAKAACYPEHIEVTDSGATIDIISLLDHTLKRILMLSDKTELQKLNKNLVFVGKYGFDGSSGQQTTRQRFMNDTLDSSSSGDENNDYYRKNFSDASVFIANLVPIEVKTADNKIVWINNKPSSTLYCRSISFKFVKESDTITIETYKTISKPLKKVKNYVLKFMDMEFNITFNFKCTMIDSKVGNVLINQKSSNCCNICKVGPKYINEIDYVLTLKCLDKFYKFGFPILHSWIRFMEYLLHISYNIDFKQWTASGSNKGVKADRKKIIQQTLKEKIGITVDVVKQGYGTTNTGNVARTFFSEYEAVSKIIGIDKEILLRLYVVLQIVSCKNNIRLDIFKDYCLETARKCVQLYGWYKMPPPVHKVLIHGCDIIKTFPKPIGFYSEEAQEANNKVFRKARIAHSRMMNRLVTNEDIAHYLLVQSDPLLSSLKIVETEDNKDFIPEAKVFLTTH